MGFQGWRRDRAPGVDVRCRRRGWAKPTREWWSTTRLWSTGAVRSGWTFLGRGAAARGARMTAAAPRPRTSRPTGGHGRRGDGRDGRADARTAFPLRRSWRNTGSALEPTGLAPGRLEVRR